MKQSNKTKGFTLIELLIVVAIIAILAAIAVPNFLEAQTRAKISASHSDMRTIATALESYRVDNNDYPLDGAILHSGQTVYPTQNPSDLANRHVFTGPLLTTPVAYLTSQPHDPFIARWEREEEAFYFYANLNQASRWLNENMGMVPPLIESRIDEWGPWMMHAAEPTLVPQSDRMWSLDITTPPTGQSPTAILSARNAEASSAVKVLRTGTSVAGGTGFLPRQRFSLGLFEFL